MPNIDEPCVQCAGKGWKDCPCVDGTIACPAGCQYGRKRCPLECESGWQPGGHCQYCFGNNPQCPACRGTNHMRCPRCNPFVLGGSAGLEDGRIRCPNECTNGRVPCPICTLYKWGAGKVGCDACHETGVVAVWHPDVPDPAIAEAAERDRLAAIARAEQDERDRVAGMQREADRARQAEIDAEAERQRLAAEAERQRALAEEAERQRQTAIAAAEAEARRVAEAAEAERQRLAADAAADEARRQAEGNA